MAHNFQTEKNKIELITEYESELEQVSHVYNQCCRLLNNFNTRASLGT
jgi:hypothetical protein